MTKPNHSRRDRTTANILVGIQVVLIVLLVGLPARQDWRVSTAMTTATTMLTLTALALGLWAAFHLGRGLTPSPLPNGSTELVTAGPYRFVRHPMYSAVILWSFGSVLASGSVAKVAAAGALLTLFLFKSRWEEQRLAASFDGYAAYMERSGRFVPSVG